MSNSQSPPTASLGIGTRVQVVDIYDPTDPNYLWAGAIGTITGQDVAEVYGDDDYWLVEFETGHPPFYREWIFLRDEEIVAVV
jgi:hypothetical protein